MTSFREYREQTAGERVEHRVPELPSDALAFQGERAGFAGVRGVQ